MKINHILIKSFMIASLIVATPVLAENTQAAISDITETVSNQKECGIDLLPPPKLTATGEVRYLSGGTCIDSVNQIKSLAKTYPLEVVLVEKTDEYDKESYIADVGVKINDAKNNLVLDIVTEGPFLLVDLPNGYYQITADFNGVTKARKVTINKKKHNRVVLLWDNRISGDQNDDQQN
jgi:hypothetical protein